MKTRAMNAEPAFSPSTLIFAVTFALIFWSSVIYGIAKIYF